MDIRVSFPGGKRVDAQLRQHAIHTDQPVELGGQDAEAAPFDLFLASLATCAGIYVLGFCQARGIPTEGVALVQHNDFDERHHLTRVELELTLPATFPEKYRAAVVNAAANCKVKKLLAAPPEIVVTSNVTPSVEVVATA